MWLLRSTASRSIRSTACSRSWTTTRSAPRSAWSSCGEAPGSSFRSHCSRARDAGGQPLARWPICDRRARPQAGVLLSQTAQPSLHAQRRPCRLALQRRSALAGAAYPVGQRLARHLQRARYRRNALPPSVTCLTAASRNSIVCFLSGPAFICPPRGQNAGLRGVHFSGTSSTQWITWSIGRHTAKQYGIPRGLPYLTGFVVHCEIMEELTA